MRDMNEDLSVQGLGTIGILFYLLVKETFTFMRRSKAESHEVKAPEVVRDMQEWHQRQSIDRLLNKISDNFERQTKVLDGILEEQKEIRNLLIQK